MRYMNIVVSKYVKYVFFIIHTRIFFKEESLQRKNQWKPTKTSMETKWKRIVKRIFGLQIKLLISRKVNQFFFKPTKNPIHLLGKFVPSR